MPEAGGRKIEYLSLATGWRNAGGEHSPVVLGAA
jgi:hypothetical protein